jgi:CTP:molybdopterin cytidylyltransferase MocA
VNHSLHALILAAGASTRLGQPKQLARIGGRAALQTTIGATQAAVEQVTVVLGAQAAQITRLLQHSVVNAIVNRQWEEGLASSIRCGIASLGPGCDAVLVVLGDQIALTANDLKRLIDAWQGQESITAAVYKSQPGVPAIFPRWCFSELMQLRGDTGAKLLLRRHAHRLIQVPMPNAAVDLDTPEDLKALQASAGKACN